MRKIKFRGKSTTEFDNQKIWIYGDLLQPTELCDIYEISDCMSIDGTRYEVDRNTIGQYTGLHDKNGKEIYEGDIVKVFKGDICIVKYNYNGFGLKVIDKNKNYGWVDFVDYNIGLIGNIYDNKNLLESEDKQ